METSREIIEQLRIENQELRLRIRESENVLNAIRSGEVDALIISGSNGDRVFSLTSSETPYRILVEKINEGVATLSADGLILYCNNRFAGLLNVPIENVIGESIFNYILDNEKPKFNLFFQNGIAGEKSSEIYFLMQADINSVYLNYSISPLPENLLGEVSLIVSDLSELIEKENELQQAHDSLEGRVVERTLELEIANTHLESEIEERVKMQKELQFSEQKLIEINAAKDKFFSILAHDLRSPFSGFIGLTEMLYQDIETISIEDMKEITQSINESAKSIYSLLTDLLQWAKTQMGNMPFEVEELDLYELVFESVYNLNKEAKQKRIELSSDVKPGMLIRCDRNMISSVIRNLVNNAIKFTREGGTVRISSTSTDNLYGIIVRDNGVGIVKERVDKLFQIGATYTSVGTAHERGTGLGLILTKEFIEKHGGKIYVESAVGLGSKFAFTLPKNLNFEELL